MAKLSHEKSGQPSWAPDVKTYALLSQFLPNLFSSQATGWA
jgi:hypothetical protein